MKDLMGFSMGCDIHIFVEYKVGDGAWTPDKNHVIHQEDDNDEYAYLQQMPFSGRNYELFGALAGVRTPGPNPKGLPVDVSELIGSNTKIDDYGDDHSHSYSSLDEFKAALKKCNINLKKFNGEYELNYDYSDCWSQLVSYIEKQINLRHLDTEAEKMLLGQDIDSTVKARLIYWFDN